MFIMISFIVLFQVLLSGIIHYIQMSAYIESWTGKRAMDIASTFAEDETVRNNIENMDSYGLIREKAKKVRETVGARYIVVANKNKIRLSHPKPERIGGKFAGGDSDRALKGETYFSMGTGTLGPALRGFAPVKNDQGHVIGFVAAGVLLKDVKHDINNNIFSPLVYVLLMTLTAICATLFITEYLRRQTLGLDPADITSLYIQKEGIIHFVREGIIAADNNGHIMTINPSAMEYLNISTPEEIIGKDITALPFFDTMESVLSLGIQELDMELVVRGHIMIFNFIPVFYEGQINGVVASFRRKDETDFLYNRLCQEQEYSEMLRSQAHEFSNIMHTIGGLLQVGEVDEALSMILQESTDYDHLVKFLKHSIKEKRLNALLLGKYNKSKELKISLEIDVSSSLKELPATLSRKSLLSIAGNLINNSFDALKDRHETEKKIVFFITDMGSDLMIEVEDNGSGVPEKLYDTVFEKGFSLNKGVKRGLGLFLVKQAVQEAGGEVFCGKSELGGALFTVIVPKEKNICD